MRAPANLDIDAIKKDAERGDASAQYALAAILSQSGEHSAADRWLALAAEQNHGDALYTIATRRFNAPARLDEAVDFLKRAVAAGSADAKSLLSVLYTEGWGIAADWRQALSLTIEAARAGAPSAAAELAMLLFALDPDDPDGVRLLALAAPRHPGAAAVAVRRAAAGAAAPGPDDLLARLKAARYPNVAALEQALRKAPASKAAVDGAPDWDGVAERLSGFPDPKANPTSEAVCETPPARVYRNAFSAAECEYLIAHAARLLAPSLIVDPQTGASRKDAYRTSLTAVLGPVDLDLALVMINRRMAALAGRPARHGEFLGVLCYGVGQEYRPHFDWLPEGAELERSGQRAATALIYLNDDYRGGETHFLTPGLHFKGATGDLLVFENVDAAGAPDQNARHAGLPVESGVKWLASKWFREKEYAF
ncbi:MAG: 2OG-Fe(II) oxygenase [Hyphococcus sp.]